MKPTRPELSWYISLRRRGEQNRRSALPACGGLAAGEEGLIAHSPAVHVRRPRIDCESHAIGLELTSERFDAAAADLEQLELASAAEGEELAEVPGVGV